jgi:hypothetical protein
MCVLGLLNRSTTSLVLAAWYHCLGSLGTGATTTGSHRVHGSHTTTPLALPTPVRRSDSAAAQPVFDHMLIMPVSQATQRLAGS